MLTNRTKDIFFFPARLDHPVRILIGLWLRNVVSVTENAKTGAPIWSTMVVVSGVLLGSLGCSWVLLSSPGCSWSVLVAPGTLLEGLSREQRNRSSDAHVDVNFLAPASHREFSQKQGQDYQTEQVLPEFSS